MNSRQKADGLVPTRRTLLNRLKRWDDQESWQQFFDTYWKLIYGVAVRAGLAGQDAQDVVQETIMSVARQMPQFKYDPEAGSFKSWLFLITRRRIADQLRRQYRHPKMVEPKPGDTSRTGELERIVDPGSEKLTEIWDEEWKTQILERALKRVKEQAEPLHYQIFDCYVRKEWSVKEVAKTFGVSTAQVYLIKHRVSTLLTRQIKAAERPPEY